MLRELVRTWLATSPAWARQLDLVHEHAAIAGRHRRMRRSWAGHLEASRCFIREAALQCTRPNRVLVIGAGDCLDVPVDDLAKIFRDVVLADIVVSPVARRIARASCGRVRCIAWDATGALQTLARVRATVVSAGARKVFEEADPGEPPGGEPDCIVSANCLSQLGLVPAHALPAARVDDGLPDRCGAVAARRHLDWLARFPDAWRVVVADTARIDLSPEGRELSRENLLVQLPLRRPDRTWRWDLAPIPEHSAEYHRVHDVGAWLDLPHGTP